MKENINDNISDEAQINLDYLKELLKDNSDIIFREFYISNWKGVLIYIDGMTDKILLDDYVLETLMVMGDKVDKVTDIKERLLTVTDVKEFSSMADGVKYALSGDCIIFIDGLKVCYVLGTRTWNARGVTEPSSETVVRGARESFTETIRFNTVLVRRKIRDTRFKLELKSYGIRSKTDVAIMYIDDIVNKEVLKELRARLEKVNIDAILDSGYIEQIIEDNKWTPFPQIQSTERPDVVAAGLYEGRIAILVDNSPFALIVPAALPVFFQSPDDYYQRWFTSSIVRIIRFTAILLSLLLPSLYIAISSFHTEIIPIKLAYSIAASRVGVPFPAFVETLIMELSLAFLLEAVVRLPRPIGSTIGIVGGLIIGQAAVSAGIVSPIMIIIVSITAITNFVVPNYEVSSALRVIRILLIILSSIIGLYGIMLGGIIVLIHLIKLESFGIPYLSPLVNPDISDFKDLFIRMPMCFFKKRPVYLKTGDKIRQK
ncbi:MAG TPA: spore germination protein [Clostridiaceae bacterium]